MSKILLLPILFAILISSSLGNAFAASSDFFLKIEGVDGESTDEKHKGTIEIDSFSWGVSNHGPMASGGGGGAGKASFSDLSYMGHVSKASPKLMMAVATGEHLKSVDLSVRKAGGTQQDYYVIHLSDVMVTSYSTTGSSGDVPMESVSFNYAKIVFEYTPTSADGTASEKITTGWDLKANIKV